METHMDTHVHHVDEISVWSWVAAAALVLIAVTCLVLATQDRITVAMRMGNPALPLAQPALLPAETVDPRV
ncbi:MAG: hypothetical protein E6G96_16890 [Alphaproteobacteria bacterium]|jgi:hypothetical protein|nr:MAG: hypothetical protein E6G96_16890 [Alphaproteobacteria bacterium]